MMKKTSFLVSAVTALFVFAAPVQAAPVDIGGLFTTGVDENGKLGKAGSVDSHYRIADSYGPTDAYITESLFSGWDKNSDTSGWVWYRSDALGTGAFKFRTEFDLTGFDLSTVGILGNWMVDDYGLDILINGVSTKQKCSLMYGGCNFSVTSGFIDGINTLDFVVDNPINPGGYGGLRVSALSGTGELLSPPTPSPVSEPASGALMLMGLGIAAAATRRKRSQ